MVQNTISIALIRPLIKAAENIAFSNLSVRATKNIKKIDTKILKLLEIPEARLSIPDADLLINQIILDNNNNSLCIYAARHVISESNCQLQNLFLCSNTLRQALRHLETFSALLSDDLDIRIIHSQKTTTKITFSVNRNHFLSQERYRNELIIGTLLGWLKQLIGNEIRINSINLPFPQPHYHPDYKLTWNCPIHFNSTECSIEFDSQYLDQELHNTNPHIHNIIKREVENQYIKLTRNGSLTDRIKQALEQQKMDFNANQKTVSDYFHMSSRTLNRHLNKEGTTLKQIITEFRIERAQQLLIETKLSVEDIAVHLGLSGRRTLDRIFIKQKDTSPAQYRHQYKDLHKISPKQEEKSVHSPSQNFFIAMG